MQPCQALYGGAQYTVTGPILAKLSAPALGDEKIKNIEFADDELIAGKVNRVIDTITRSALAENFGVVNSHLRVYMPNISDEDRILFDPAHTPIIWRTL